MWGESWIYRRDKTLQRERNIKHEIRIKQGLHQSRHMPSREMYSSLTKLGLVWWKAMLIFHPTVFHRHATTVTHGKESTDESPSKVLLAYKSLFYMH